MTIPVTLVNVGTNPNDNTGDPAQVAFTKINTSLTSLSVNAGTGGGSTAVASPDSTLIITGSGTSSVTVSAAPLNVLPGTYSYAGLPAAASNVNKLAATTDRGVVFSNGAYWEILFNATTGVLAISTSSPLPPAANGVLYSDTFVATGNVGTTTWTLVSSFGATNAWVMSSVGVLTGTPSVNTTDTLMIQVSDTTGAVAQRLVTITTSASLTPAATPTFSPAAGSYSSTQTVTISDATSTPTIYYTTNGSTPTTGSTVYTTPITVSTTQTVKAIATAPGFTQSAVGSAAYTINTVQNPIGVNFAAGGQAVLEYEEFPIWVDLIRVSRGFCIGSSFVYASRNSAGFPDGTQGTITIVLFTGANTLLGLQPWFYNSGTSSYRTFKGSITSGTGLETPSATGGCTVANIARPGGGVVTFDLTFNGSGAVILGVANVTTAWTACHVYLPDYPTGNGVGPNNELTSDAVNHYAQFGFTRFMWPQNAWNNITHATAANRNTPSNTVNNKGWSVNSANSEGYPVEWFVNLCIAANTGGWFCLPADCANDYITAVANLLFASMPVGKPIIIELGNENWNGTGLAHNLLIQFANTAGSAYQTAQFTGTIVGNQLTTSAVTGTIVNNDSLFYSGSTNNLVISGSSSPYTLNTSPGNIGPVAMTSSNVNKMYSWLAVPLHNIATIFKGVFGARYGTDLTIHLGTIQNGSFLALQTIQNSITQGYMPSTGWASAATADYHYIAVAPYLNLLSPSAGWTVAQIEANLAGTDASGNTKAANIVCNANSGMEKLSVLAHLYGLLGTSCYEGSWQTVTESSTITNIGNSIVDSGMIAVEQTLTQNIFNSGSSFYCRFEGGVAGLTALSGSSMLFNQFDYSYANLIAGNSPRLKAIAPFYNGATPAKNVVNGTGSKFSALNYSDNLTVTFPTFGLFGLVPPYNANGLVAWNVNCLTAGTYSLRVYFTNASGTAGLTDVNIDGAIVITGAAIGGSITNSLVTLGNVTLTKGSHCLVLGRSGTFNANITVGATANAGGDINWI